MDAILASGPLTMTMAHKQGLVDRIVHDDELESALSEDLGRQVTVLAEGELIPGYHRVVWDGRDTQGRAVAAGVYLVELRTAQQRLVHKLMLLK